ncbi:helix-turn-helix transcriptional regulator [Rhizobium sp. P32RR-XVIII]|uniref:helix-turn-helix domain-containing protein n=1 Tax=Rhizobium sp. P32RR-XVIII TaxID=2726738 RepID=UPI0014567E61|nr:AraC family transcriptional regulator [Rhizobium sp. P32RR-XVIII]NLS07071.1 helix-turn-helix transcriptional regulator [Rhizobium sp. P32RR-XVIII]
MFDTAAFASPQQGFERLCELIVDICDAAMLGEVENFRVVASTLHLGNALLLDGRSSALRYNRTPEHIARGLDHFQLVMYLGGGAEFIVGERTFLQRAGDVSLINMSKPHLTREIPGDDGVARVLSFMLPRPLLAPLFAAIENVPTITVARRETAFGALIGEHMLALKRYAAQLTQAERQAAAQSLAQLAAGGMDSHADNTAPLPSSSQEALRARIKRHIEDNLSTASLDVTNLCRRFALSRASLYRLFAPQSPASYIQQRRLHRAFAILVSPAFRPWRIIDVAVECQFSSDATFIRAFRREFGLTPGEARERSLRTSNAPPDDRPAEPRPDAEAARWVAELTGAIPQLSALRTIRQEK